MKIAFDPAKDAANLAKHRVSLALAADLEWDLMLAGEDAREAYGEQRWIGFAPIGRTLYCVVFTEDQTRYRIVSMRKATPREVRDYASHI
jgi:uncharacterized protein